MGPTTIIALAVAAVALLAVIVLAFGLRAERRRTATLLARGHQEQEALRERVDALVAARREVRERAEFVITTAGEPAYDAPVPDRLVLSATLGEPLLRAAALAHGLRRALSPESRNRILFEMRREVRRARKQRRQEMRQAWRKARAQDAA